LPPGGFGWHQTESEPCVGFVIHQGWCTAVFLRNISSLISGPLTLGMDARLREAFPSSAIPFLGTGSRNKWEWSV
jgi:hypothetical protein